MKRVLSTVVLVALGAVSFAQADKEGDPNGTWKWTESFGGKKAFEMTAKLQREGDRLTGTITGRDGKEASIENGRFIAKGNTIKFEAKNPPRTYHGKLDGDAIKGFIQTGILGKTKTNEFRWEAKRVTE
jgi:hypothetical protein